MPGSLDDLRDSYKNSRQKKPSKYGLNGATYKMTYSIDSNNNLHGGLVTRHDTTSAKNECLKKINQQYCLDDSRMAYSLNKKKRWELKSTLISNMNELKDENVDARLYEMTSNENNGSYNTKLTGVHKSKGY